MTRVMLGATLLAIALAPAVAPAQPVTEEFRREVEVNVLLSKVSEALPAPGASLRAALVPSPRPAATVRGDQVTVTTGFLAAVSSNALAAAVVYQVLPDPVYFAITMHRARFDGPAGLVELTQRLLRDPALEDQYRIAVLAAYHELVRVTWESSFWIFARPGYQPFYWQEINAARARYDWAVQAYQAYLATRPTPAELPAISAEFAQATAEVTAVLRGGDPAEVSPWRLRIEQALAGYPPARAE